MVPKHYAIRSESHKLIHYYQFDEWEFFDLNKDPWKKTIFIPMNCKRKRLIGSWKT